MKVEGERVSSDLIAAAARQFAAAGRFSYVSVKPDLTIDQVEQNFGKMIGWPNETIGGRPLNDLFWEFVGSEDALQEILEGKRRRLRFEHVNREQEDGTIRYLTFVITLLEEARSDDGLLLIVEDTSDYGALQQKLVQDRNELRLVRQELDQANEALENLNRMKSLLLSMAAHDLRAPLTSIHAFAEFLKEDVVGERQHEYLDIITVQSDRLRRLINDLLDLDKIEQGKLFLARRECDLNEIVIEAATVLEPVATMRRQILSLDLDNRPGILMADPERLTQVVYNLIGNAVNYTQEEGQIRVVTRWQNESIELKVIDNGQGIAEDQIANLFTLYYRSTEARRSAVPGSGLGLFIAKTLVEAHRGQITVESNLGQGTSFMIRLPVNLPKVE